MSRDFNKKSRSFSSLAQSPVCMGKEASLKRYIQKVVFYRKQKTKMGGEIFSDNGTNGVWNQ